MTVGAPENYDYVHLSFPLFRDLLLVRNKTDAAKVKYVARLN